MAKHIVVKIGIIAIFAPLAIMLLIVIFLKVRKRRKQPDPKQPVPRAGQQPRRPLRRPRHKVEPPPSLLALEGLTEKYLERRDVSEILPIVSELQDFFSDAAQRNTPLATIPVHYTTAILDARVYMRKAALREARFDLLVAEKQLAIAPPQSFVWNQALTLVEAAYGRYGNAAEALLKTRVILNGFEIHWGFRQHWAFKRRTRISMADSWFSTAILGAQA